VTAYCRNTSAIGSITEKVIAVITLRNFETRAEGEFVVAIVQFDAKSRSCGEQANYE
jgi:hypothetical protein